MRPSNMTSGHKSKQPMAEKDGKRSWVMVNRAPVLTLWAAVVGAEVLGFEHDQALTLGRALAGLNVVCMGGERRAVSRVRGTVGWILSREYGISRHFGRSGYPDQHGW